MTMTGTAVDHDVLDLLIEQHTRIRELFAEVEASAAAARAELFHRLVRLLAAHEAADGRVVHPLTRLHVHGGDHIVADRLAQERANRETLAALTELGPDAPEFPRLLGEFRTTVLEHANHEEAYEFCYLRRDVPAEELRALSSVLKTEPE
jgi:Hemerythrin HHE cation binding domain